MAPATADTPGWPPCRRAGGPDRGRTRSGSGRRPETAIWPGPAALTASVPGGAGTSGTAAWPFTGTRVQLRPRQHDQVIGVEPAERGRAAGRPGAEGRPSGRARTRRRASVTAAITTWVAAVAPLPDLDEHRDPHRVRGDPHRQHVVGRRAAARSSVGQADRHRRRGRRTAAPRCRRPSRPRCCQRLSQLTDVHGPEAASGSTPQGQRGRARQRAVVDAAAPAARHRARELLVLQRHRGALGRLARLGQPGPDRHLAEGDLAAAGRVADGLAGRAGPGADRPGRLAAAGQVVQRRAARRRGQLLDVAAGLGAGVADLPVDFQLDRPGDRRPRRRTCWSAW